MAMISPVHVVNLALARLTKEPIVSLDENTDRAKAAKPVWAISLHLFLNESEWSFARTERKAERIKLDEGQAAQFRYAYALPDDCIKLTGVRRDGGNSFCRHVDYRVARYDAGKRQAVLANAEGILIEYVTNRANLSDFPPEAIDALACRVACEIAMAMDNNTQRADQMMQFYELAVSKAKKNDVAKEPPRRMAGRDYTFARLWSGFRG